MSPPAICCGITPSFCSTRPGKSTDAELETLEVVDRVDLLAEPAAHLTAGVAGEQGNAIEFLVEFVEHLPAAAEHVPGLVKALVGSEWHRSAEGEGRVLAEVVV